MFKSRYLKDYQLLPNALSGEDALIKHLSDKKIAVFLDYDGTLTPITPHPEEAVLNSEMRHTIQELARQKLVAIVSGRDKKNIQELVALPNLFYIGNHGFDIEGPPLGIPAGANSALPDEGLQGGAERQRPSSSLLRSGSAWAQYKNQEAAAAAVPPA
ncbi:MAG: trehalose-phosphatase, partial [Proteobacteria bacterium]|nr:trehalose-phosphatase [Pseudomonadota bacterium]